MRIISGRFKGKRLVAPAGLSTRPTSDRARQGLFNMLEHTPWSPGLQGARVLDLFAGTGGFGLEALSRGAAVACFVEQDRAALSALRANIAALPLEPEAAKVIAGDARRLPRPMPDGLGFDLVFADPPYRQGLALQALAAMDLTWLTPGAVAIIEEATDLELPVPDGWAVIETRAYGAARFWVLRRQP